MARDYLSTLDPADLARVRLAMLAVAREGRAAARHLRGDVYEVRAGRAWRVLFAGEGRYNHVLPAPLEELPLVLTVDEAATVFVAGRRGDGNPNLSHAWCRTVEGAQGVTWEAVHLLGTASLGSSGLRARRPPT